MLDTVALTSMAVSPMQSQLCYFLDPALVIISYFKHMTQYHLCQMLRTHDNYESTVALVLCYPGAHVLEYSC